MKLRTKFQDEDFELGEVVNAKISDLTVYDDDRRFKVKATARKGGEHTFFYNSIKEFTDMWEDYEEPEEYWYYDTTKNGIDKITHLEDKEKDQEIGNYFETKEEAEKAVEKLKAWQRLINHGLCLKLNKFQDRIEYKFKTGGISSAYDAEEALKDLDLLFGGEE